MQFRLGAIKPSGWIKASMQRDMQGFTGKLDELVPSLIREHRIYSEDRITATSKQVELGKKADLPIPGEEIVEDNPAQYMWWNSETQSNWMDGFVRNALLLNDEQAIAKVRNWLAQIIASQDSDGYLGIYTTELRFKMTSENGELWAQSTLYRALLAYYEATGESQILEKICSALDCLLCGYPLQNSRPFFSQEKNGAGGGQCHGLTIIDTLHRVYELTGRVKYLDYALWLYKSYCAENVSEGDTQITSLLDPHYHLKGHGVHSYENMRAPILLARYDASAKSILAAALEKIAYCTTPSGAALGDEWIMGRKADATYTAYEFCSVHELLASYSLLMCTTAKLNWGDKIEWLYYNAALGMKHPHESSIMYLKCDNCYTADEHKHPDDLQLNVRYKYSPTHQDAAVCCVPMAGRITPYFLQSGYLSIDTGFKVALYMPSSLETEYQGNKVRIEQVTQYPFELSSNFTVNTDHDCEFALYLRIPAWANSYTINIEAEYLREENELLIKRKWLGSTEFRIDFFAEIQIHEDMQNAYYVTRGPLVYALPLPSKEEIVKELILPGFSEKIYRPLDRSLEKLKLDKSQYEYFVFNGGAQKTVQDLRIKLPLICDTGTDFYELVPMGNTILRKVTFEKILKD